MNKQLRSLKKIYSGKVRDLYEIDSNSMLMVASDRLSTFDIILNQQIPNKGEVLTKLSFFWFNYLKHIVPNHIVPNGSAQLQQILSPEEYIYAKNRSMVVKRLRPLPVEVIIRGYLAGTGYTDYLKTGEISGIQLPTGLKLAQKLPQPIFTPSTKAVFGEHDENISIKQCESLIGDQLTEQVERIALNLYQTAAAHAINSGIIIADTKFEFGLDEDGKLTLMDEVLTPDSSRFWDLNNYQVGINPQSFDKQFVRDYLSITLKWDKKPPIPDLPQNIISGTVDKYLEIIRRFHLEIC